MLSGFESQRHSGKKAGIILSGHTDTVPWDGQAWTVDPLSGIVQDGRLYARGSADMKSFIAIALANAKHFLESPAPFAVHFAFSYDEEVVKLIASRCTEPESGGRMIDAILTNTLLAQVSRELLERVSQGQATSQIGVAVEGTEFKYSFA